MCQLLVGNTSINSHHHHSCTSTGPSYSHNVWSIGWLRYWLLVAPVFFARVTNHDALHWLSLLGRKKGILYCIAFNDRHNIQHRWCRSGISMMAFRMGNVLLDHLVCGLCAKTPYHDLHTTELYIQAQCF